MNDAEEALGEISLLEIMSALKLSTYPNAQRLHDRLMQPVSTQLSKAHLELRWLEDEYVAAPIRVEEED